MFQTFFRSNISIGIDDHHQGQNFVIFSKTILPPHQLTEIFIFKISTIFNRTSQTLDIKSLFNVLTKIILFKSSFKIFSNSHFQFEKKFSIQDFCKAFLTKFKFFFSGNPFL